MSPSFCEGLVPLRTLAVSYVVAHDGSFELKFGIEASHRLGEKNETVIVYPCVSDNNIKNFLHASAQLTCLTLVTS